MDDINEKLREKMNNGREYRNIIQELEVRAAEEGEEKSYIVEGYATTFNTVYRLYDGQYYKVDERIDPHAFDECDMSDVIMQYDHVGHVFARTSNKTLQLSIDGHGLKMRADLSGTGRGRNLYEEIAGGYTNKMSFGFVVAEDQRTVTEDHENNVETVLRTITKISKLYDVSAVSLPANDATEISARSFGEGIIAELEKEHLERRERDSKVRALTLRMEIFNHEN